MLCPDAPIFFLLLKRRCFVQDHEYLVEPVSVQATMRRNVSLLPLRASDTPRLALDITLQKFVVALSERQYRDMVLWMKEIDRYDRAYKYRKWRPTCTVRDRSVNNNTITCIALLKIFRDPSSEAQQNKTVNHFQDPRTYRISFQISGAATEKVRLPRFSLVLGIESCCEVDDRRCLGTLEECRRLSR